MPKQTPLKKRLREGVFQFVKNRDGKRLPTQFERKGAMTNITHRQESRVFRDKIPILVSISLKEALEKWKSKPITTLYVAKCLQNDSVLFPTRKREII